jgi:hypothetical protein
MIPFPGLWETSQWERDPWIAPQARDNPPSPVPHGPGAIWSAGRGRGPGAGPPTTQPR